MLPKHKIIWLFSAKMVDNLSVYTFFGGDGAPCGRNRVCLGMGHNKWSVQKAEYNINHNELLPYCSSFVLNCYPLCYSFFMKLYSTVYLSYSLFTSKKNKLELDKSFTNKLSNLSSCFRINTPIWMSVGSRFFKIMRFKIVRDSISFILEKTILSNDWH